MIRVITYIFCSSFLFLCMISSPCFSQENRNSSYRCPADNVGFWEEIKEAGWLGFGETWDFNTCDEGFEIFAEGANSRWRQMRTRSSFYDTPYALSPERARLFGQVLPALSIFILIMLVFIAWAYSTFQRKKAKKSVTINCPKCSKENYIFPQEKGQFCMYCGEPIALKHAYNS